MSKRPTLICYCLQCGKRDNPPPGVTDYRLQGVVCSECYERGHWEGYEEEEEWDGDRERRDV